MSQLDATVYTCTAGSLSHSRGNAANHNQESGAYDIQFESVQQKPVRFKPLPSSKTISSQAVIDRTSGKCGAL